MIPGGRVSGGGGGGAGWRGEGGGSIRHAKLSPLE